MARRLILQQAKTANLATMASLLRTFSITAGLLRSAQAVKPLMASPVSTWMGWLSKPAIAGSLQQTRGMKVHSSVKKRCEHCKVGWKWIYKHRLRCMQWGTCSWANIMFAGRSTKGRKATQRIPVHHLQGESSTQAATELSNCDTFYSFLF